MHIVCETIRLNLIDLIDACKLFQAEMSASASKRPLLCPQAHSVPQSTGSGVLVLSRAFFVDLRMLTCSQLGGFWLRVPYNL